jgi:vacuolar-type H+-ATPase subunit H
MENTLKRLLNAETQAEKTVADASAKREKIVEQALREAHQAEITFRDQLPDIKKSFVTKAQQRAEQSIAELNKRYNERKTKLREMAEQHQYKAVDATVDIVLQVGASK